jgi:hypothetical protein
MSIAKPRAVVCSPADSSRLRFGGADPGIAWKSRLFRASRGRARPLALPSRSPAHITTAWRGRNFIAIARADRAAIAQRTGRFARVDLAYSAD